MNVIEYRYEVIVRVLFTQGEINHLIELSLAHYDRKCKAAGSQGGFLYGYRNHLEFCPGDAVMVDADQAATLSKILEGPGADPKLRIKMRKLQIDLADEWVRVNEKGEAPRGKNPGEGCLEVEALRDIVEAESSAYGGKPAG